MPRGVKEEVGGDRPGGCEWGGGSCPPAPTLPFQPGWGGGRGRVEAAAAARLLAWGGHGRQGRDWPAAGGLGSRGDNGSRRWRRRRRLSLHGRRRQQERRVWPARRSALTEVRGRDEGGRDVGRPGPLSAPNPLCAGSWLGQRPTPARSTPATSPGSGRWAPPWGRGSAYIGLNPLSPPSASAPPAAPTRGCSSPWRQPAAPAPALGSAPCPSPDFSPLPSSRRQPPRALLACALLRDPCPAPVGRRMSLHHQHLSSLSPTWHCPLATHNGPVLSDET